MDLCGLLRGLAGCGGVGMEFAGGGWAGGREDEVEVTATPPPAPPQMLAHLAVLFAEEE